MLRRAAPTSPPIGSAMSTMLHSSRLSDPPPIALVPARPRASYLAAASAAGAASPARRRPGHQRARPRPPHRSRAFGLAATPPSERPASTSAATTAATSGSSSPRSQQEARMPAGFWNMGQSCHLGATLTALAALPSMQRWVRSRDSAVARALCASAVGGTADGGRGAGPGTAQQPLDPRPVAQQIDAGEWRAIEAQDAHETLGRLLTALEEEDRSLRVLDQPPPPRAPLYGWSTVIRTCETCGASSDAILQTFSVLSLPLPTSNRSLAPSFIDAFASTDVDVQAHCDMCGSNEPHSRMHSIARFPRVLVLHLQKAFLAPDESIDASQYSTTFPEVLTLPRGNPVPPIPRKLRYHEEPATVNGSLVTNGDFPHIPRRPMSAHHRGGVRYSLRGVVQHHGGAGSSAHFIAVVGGGAGSPEDGLAGLSGGRWWIVDDGRVRRGTRADALNSRSAYLLFYELMDDP